MKFTKVRDLKYSKADNSTIDLLATCIEYGEIPMTLNIVDTEDLHTCFDGQEWVPLEAYCIMQTIAQYVAPAIVIPTSITRLQAKLQLIKMNLYNSVEAMLDANTILKVYWMDANNFKRNDEILKEVATALNLTDAQVDEMFIAASKL